MKHTQKQCDKLLTPIIKKLHPKCLLCGGETQVAHHHFHKSKSSNLRYDIKNLVNLCSKCHLKLHWNESFWGSKVAQIKGNEWLNYLEANKNTIIKPDYDAIYERLKKYEVDNPIIYID